MASLPDPTKSLTGEGLKVYEDIASRRAAKGVHHLGPYVPLLNDPELARRVEQLGYYYKYEATLPRDIYQFIVLVFAKHCDVEFEWLDHVASARAAGLTDEMIDAIAKGETAFAAPFDKVHACMGYALKYQSIPRELQDEIIAAYGITGLLEIVTLCGFYGLIGMINACFDVPLPPMPKA